MGVLGVVVFGVGIAGRIRMRDLKDPDNSDGSWKLLGYVSRLGDKTERFCGRQVHVEGVDQLTEEDALSRSDVHAFVVCTEPGSHEEIIRKGLCRGKHILVEYPLATTTAVTKELHKLATEKALVLHEENIALLTPGFLSVREQVKKSKVPIKKAEIKLVGNYNGWVEDFAKSGGPLVAGVSLIQTLYKVVGEDIRATGGELEKNDQGFTAVARLSSQKCSDLVVTVQRCKERTKREKVFQIEFEDGKVIIEKPEMPQKKSEQGPKKVGLFMADFNFFLSVLNKERDQDKNVRRTMHCIEVAEEVHKFMNL